MRIWNVIFVVTLLLGCKRPVASVPAPSPSDLAEFDRCDFSLLTPVKPNRLTHLAVDPSANVYFTQEMADGSDVMFVVGAGDVTTATRLTSANILAQLGAKGVGNIQSIAAARDGSILFYFAGGTNKSYFACLGRFDRRTDAIKILADSPQLETVTGMNASLSLARGNVACSGPTAWLLVHHSDAASLFTMPVSNLSASGAIDLGRPMRFNSTEDAPPMTADQTQISAGDGASILLLDFPTTALWRIGSDGRADVLQSLVGLPVSISVPGEDSHGRIVIFTPNTNLIDPRVNQRVVPINTGVPLPSIVILENGKLRAVGRDDLHTPENYPLAAMQLQQVIYEPSRDTWVGYDAPSGQLVRFRIVAK